MALPPGAPSLFNVRMTMLNGEPIETPNISTAPTPPPPPPAPPRYTASGVDAAQWMGITSVILAFTLPVVGIVIAALGMSRAKQQGQPPGLARVALILSIIMTVVVVIVTTVIIVLSVTVFSQLFQICQQLGTGVHVVDGVTYTCNV